MTKAKNITGQAPGGERVRLADVLPLSAPFLLYIFPIYACNFRCVYCIFSVKKSKRGFISDKVALDFDLYKRCIDEAERFSKNIKVLRFVGMGEPLLHKNIVEMIEYAVKKEVAQTVEIITNGSLLTAEISDSLVSAGLTRMIISLQGTSAAKYNEVSKVAIDFRKFVGNIEYFFKRRKQTHLYIKIMDTALDSKEDEKRFYDIFGNICDSIGVEHTVPIYPGVDYENVLKTENWTVTQFGLPVAEIKICPQPFFAMQINPDGKVVPCFSLDYPEIIGDCHQQSVYDIWHSERFQNFRRKMLDGRKNVCGTCAECKISTHRMFPEDVLDDDDAERLKKFYA